MRARQIASYHGEAKRLRSSAARLKGRQVAGVKRAKGVAEDDNGRVSLERAFLCQCAHPLVCAVERARVRRSAESEQRGGGKASGRQPHVLR